MSGIKLESSPSEVFKHYLGVLDRSIQDYLSNLIMEVLEPSMSPYHLPITATTMVSEMNMVFCSEIINKDSILH